MKNKEFKIKTSAPTPHNEAKKGDIADTVILPGDPQRAELIAKEYLENTKLVNNIREVRGYTGTYRGEKITVMASGMGCPSMAIYAHELFHNYNVNNIIRTGTSGAIVPYLHLGDLVIAQAAGTNGGYLNNFDIDGIFCPIADFDLLNICTKICNEKKVSHSVGNVLTTDRFYNYNDDYRRWQRLGVLAEDMECCALYAVAAYANKRALTLLSVSNSYPNPEEDMSAHERIVKFNDMLTIALETAVKAKSLKAKPSYFSE